MCIQGDNLDSVETSEIGVTVGGEECTTTPGSLRGSEIICTAPWSCQEGKTSHHTSEWLLKLYIAKSCYCPLQVNVGSNISQVLDQQLTYTCKSCDCSSTGSSSGVYSIKCVSVPAVTVRVAMQQKLQASLHVIPKRSPVAQRRSCKIIPCTGMADSSKQQPSLLIVPFDA